MNNSINKVSRPILPSLSVDGSWQASTGMSEWQVVDTETKEVMFSSGPVPGGTNNIAEFLALASAMIYCHKNGLHLPIYSDSVSARAWARDSFCNTDRRKLAENTSLLNYVVKSEKVCSKYGGKFQILTWDTENWGENPADFGRKNSWDGQVARMEYSKALKIAEETLELLRPHCYLCEIAGSIRRKKPFVKDIEIVAYPKPYRTNLLESGIATVVNRWKKVKGELPCKYTQRILPQGIKLDLFFADIANWGYIYAIRTGSHDFSKTKLAYNWVKKGYRGKDGYLTKGGFIVPVPDEKYLFELIGVPYVEPEDRL